MNGKDFKDWFLKGGMGNFQEKVTFIWDLADLLRGVYKRNEYQKVILPFTVLKRFDSVLSDLTYQLHFH